MLHDDDDDDDDFKRENNNQLLFLLLFYRKKYVSFCMSDDKYSIYIFFVKFYIHFYSLIYVFYINSNIFMEKYGSIHFIGDLIKIEHLQ